VQRDPPGIPAHQLHHEDPLVAFRGGVEFIDRLGRGAHRGVEPESRQGSRDVVIDGLGDADDRQSLLPQLVGNEQTAVAPDGNQGIEPAGVEGGNELVGPIDFDLGPVLGHPAIPERIPPVGGAQNGSAQVGDALHLAGAQAQDTFIFQEAVEPPADAIGLPAALIGGKDNGPDDGIEAGGVTAAGRDGYAHRGGKRRLPRP
jgi:hypothetical protein